MYSTFHNALDSWPAARSQSGNVDSSATQTSRLYDKITFGEDDNPPSASSVFKVTGANYPEGKVFVPPFFVPPGNSTSRGLPTESRSALQRDVATSGQQSCTVEPDENIDPAIQDARHFAPKQRSLPPSVARPDLQAREGLEHQSRSPSPALNSTDLQRQRELNWSDSARKAFYLMINAPGYVNRYRLIPTKYQRLLACLRNPDVEPLDENGNKDHQTKYQAAKWVLQDGKLYRKAERKGTSRNGLRRHLDVNEVWNVLTAEHLRTDHLGRDRLRKVLEKRYIGYTLQEIMFVLRECKSCNGRTKPPTNAQLDEQHAIDQVDLARTDEVGDDMSGSDQRHFTRASQAQHEKQTSNFMWF